MSIRSTRLDIDPRSIWTKMPFEGSDSDPDPDPHPLRASKCNALVRKTFYFIKVCCLFMRRVDYQRNTLAMSINDVENLPTMLIHIDTVLHRFLLI